MHILAYASGVYDTTRHWVLVTANSEPSLPLDGEDCYDMPFSPHKYFKDLAHSAVVWIYHPGQLFYHISVVSQGQWEHFQARD